MGAQTDAVALERYRVILRGELARVELSDAEWSLLGEAWAPTQERPDRWSVAGLDVSVELAIADDELDRKWGVSGDDLVAKLRALPFAGRCAIVEELRRRRSGRASSGSSPSSGR